MTKAGCYLGHIRYNSHPKSKKIVTTQINEVDVIDLEKTVQYFQNAQKFLADLVAKGGTILFVGTKRQASELTKSSAIDVGMPYVANRWLGGTLTNFQTIRKRVNYFERMSARFNTGAFESLTKKELLEIERELEKLESRIGGLRKLKKPPQALVIVDPQIEEVALREALNLNIPIVGTADTNIDLSKLSYPIPINDDSKDSVEIFYKAITEAIKEGLKKQGKEKVGMQKGEVTR